MRLYGCIHISVAPEKIHLPHVIAVRKENLSFVLAAVATIFRDVGLVSLILFFFFGWSFRRAGRDAAPGAAPFIP
jgi:hypothetical protein